MVSTCENELYTLFLTPNYKRTFRDMEMKHFPFQNVVTEQLCAKSVIRRKKTQNTKHMVLSVFS